uniref:Helix-turn-helix transcriptional regulator n=1 Tax=Roseihalotalea indica TaxID=2867963 RepID=A0AA49GRG6_9BACT|nr:helix-turn-helix transcriptional regulator [Tunicatimonas sp. TK19036]
MKDPVTIYVKGMVCDRCKKVLNQAFEEIGLEVKEMRLGAVTLAGTGRLPSMEPIRTIIRENGFELLPGQDAEVVSAIKREVDGLFSQREEQDLRIKFSTLLSEKFPMSYERLSAIFSAAEGITLEKYLINQRLEKVKELLVYTDYTLTKIANLTGFGGIQHLSNQFKELTGLSPSHFREVKASKKQLSDRTE